MKEINICLGTIGTAMYGEIIKSQIMRKPANVAFALGIRKYFNKLFLRIFSERPPEEGREPRENNCQIASQ